MSSGHQARPRRRTKIVCTIGPASSTAATIEELVKAGMDCARLNFSHGTPEEHFGFIEKVRRASQLTGRRVAVMQDLPGPKLRIGKLKDGSVQIAKGSTVSLTTRQASGDASMIPVRSKDLPKYVKPGGTVFLADGSIKLKILDTTETDIKCRCETGGALLSGKGVNIPDLKLGFKTFTQRDKRYLALGLEHGVDLVAVSFVRTASDIEEVKEFVGKKKCEPKVVAKIEKKEAVDNIDRIIEAADAVMVARGDMGVENPIEEVPELQKSIISKCMSKAVPVITATQMLESMVDNASPTRAEVTDVANAIFDGTDAVMLSEETAVGKYPVECVGVMNRVALKAEEMLLDGEGMGRLAGFRRESHIDALSEAAYQISQDIGAGAVAIQSDDEAILPRISRFRPRAPIFFVSESEEKLRKSKIIWGVYQVDAGEARGHGSSAELVRRLAKDGIVRWGDSVVVIRGAAGTAKEPGFFLSISSAGGRKRQGHP
jgi:pyruvate kinase